MRAHSAACRPLAILIGLVCALGSPTVALAVAGSAVPLGPNGARSYWVVTRTGQVCHAGEAKPYGDGHGTVVGIDATNDGKGYWLVLKSGRTEAFGDARHHSYRKAKLTKWSKALGACKDDVVGAAVAKLTSRVKSRPTAPVKTTPSTAPASSITPSGGSTLSITAGTTVPPAASTATSSGGTPTAPAPVTSTTSSTSMPPPPESPTITTTTIPGGEVGLSYDESLSATGGDGGYVWSRISGQIPSGLSLSSAGRISGTPTTAGTYAFMLDVADSDGANTEQSYSVTVLPAVSVNTTTLPAGEAGVAYAGASVSASGGEPPYTWSVTGGALPAGMDLSHTGSLGGTPAASGDYALTATVTDALGATSSQSYTVTVDAQPNVATSELPDPVQTLPYDQQLAATNGSGSDTWQVTSGTLPAGLSLSSSGEITGTPTTPGGYNVTVQVTDALGGTATKTYSGITATWHEDENWSGYAAYGAGPYTSVSGTFNVPPLLSGVQSTDDTGIWVGIDGADNNTLLQAGVDADDTNDGTGTYYAWTEEVPQQTTSQHVGNFAVSPGDSITVDIAETDHVTSTWMLAITDNTTGQTYSTSEVYTGAGETAEWIAEATTGPSGHLDPMAIWNGAIDFTNLSASRPATELDYMTLSPGFVSGGAMNSLLDSSGFAVTDDEQVPAPLTISGQGP